MKKLTETKIKSGKIIKALRTPYVSFEMHNTGFAVRGCDRIENLPFISLNSSQGMPSTKIPAPILKAYGIASNDSVFVEPIGGGDFFVRKEVISDPEFPNKAILTNVYDTKRDISDLPVRSNGILKSTLDISSFIKCDPQSKYQVTFVKENGYYIRIHAAKKIASYSYDYVKSIYGNSLQNYPYDSLSVVVDNPARIPIPEWFYKEYPNLEYEIKVVSNSMLYMLPVIYDDFTGENINTVNSGVNKIVTCKSCTNDKPLVKEIISLKQNIDKQLTSLNRMLDLVEIDEGNKKKVASLH